MADKTTNETTGKAGDGFLGWLGRQIGHVTKAVKADVTRPVAPPAGHPGGASPAAGGSPLPHTPQPQGGANPAAAGVPDAPAGTPKVIYRNDKVEEMPHPEKPGVKLRRTVIDEVIVEDKIKEGTKNES